ncbi:MAG TPA: intradiol ring-cleavage dioxygenase [Geminicoccaceae bacterium]|nr:intradiol ring-cleavage dioxygenase [Geminicoccus sp.]HMU52012.1 intradiol ring-cleavage dioxygenase [Geminicoccaceae bacterium]
MLLSRRSALVLAAFVPAGWRMPQAEAGTCLLLPQAVEGPFYFDPHLVRADIIEGRKGIPLGMELTVVGADCRPLADARVDLWHADAQGIYSGYDRQGDGRDLDTRGETFLRGTQLADAEGTARFATILPGWYQGRTTHLHFKVFLAERAVLTGQIYLPDALNEFIYENVAAYRRPRQRDTFNSTDFIAGAGGEGAFAAVREESGRYLASLVVGVDPTAKAMSGDRPPGGPGGPPPGAGPPPRARAPTGDARVRALVPGGD